MQEQEQEYKAIVARPGTGARAGIGAGSEAGAGD
jgi:hypothetical protein